MISSRIWSHAPPRKPRPDYVTRAEAEAMIAAAVAAERARSEQAMAGFMVALGGAARAMEEIVGAIDRHEAVIAPWAAMVAAEFDRADAVTVHDADGDAPPN